MRSHRLLRLTRDQSEVDSNSTDLGLLPRMGLLAPDSFRVARHPSRNGYCEGKFHKPTSRY